MDRCDACPVDPGIECEAVRTKHVRYCRHVEAGRVDFIRMLRDVSGRPRPAPGTFPPLREQARSLARAVVRHALAGMPATPPEVLAIRLAICGGCDQLQDGRCLACGCSVRHKAAWELEACPLGKWPESGATMPDPS
jgi:uncharacterized protein DUF6171